MVEGGGGYFARGGHSIGVDINGKLASTNNRAHMGTGGGGGGYGNGGQWGTAAGFGGGGSGGVVGGGGICVVQYYELV